MATKRKKSYPMSSLATQSFLFSKDTVENNDTNSLSNNDKTKRRIQNWQLTNIIGLIWRVFVNSKCIKLGELVCPWIWIRLVGIQRIVVDNRDFPRKKIVCFVQCYCLAIVVGLLLWPIINVITSFLASTGILCQWWVWLLEKPIIKKNQMI